VPGGVPEAHRHNRGMEPVTLSTERLLLRPLEPRDVDPVHAACQDPAIRRWTTVPDPYEREHAMDFVLNVTTAGWREDTMYSFGVFTGEGALAGAMGLQLHAAGRLAELGYWTARGHRGNGYTTEAGRAAVDWAFAKLGVERLEWWAEVGNEGSRAVALRLGFVMEGVQRAKLLHHGTRRDAWAAALLPSDWGRPSATPYLPAL
jgi:RimJ/RimL family protein N-acetyltransferase